MYNYFNKIAEQQEMRGWRLLKNEEGFFISKFDDRFNDDEYRFFVHYDEYRVHILRMEKIKSYKKTMKIDESCEYAALAKSLCESITAMCKRR